MIALIMLKDETLTIILYADNRVLLSCGDTTDAAMSTNQVLLDRTNMLIKRVITF